MQSCCYGYLDPIGLLDMTLEPRKKESNYVLCLAALVAQTETMKGLMELHACCLDQPYDGNYSTRYAKNCS